MKTLITVIVALLLCMPALAQQRRITPYQVMDTPGCTTIINMDNGNVDMFFGLREKKPIVMEPPFMPTVLMPQRLKFKKPLTDDDEDD
jgi:hypothetical protein